MKSDNKVIELTNVHKVYKTGAEDVHALRGVSLDINQGEFLAIMGPSGSGKSTFMNIIGLLDSPTSGDYLLDGELVGRIGKRRKAKIRNQRIGFVFQQFNMLPRTSALDNVLLPTIYGDRGNSVKYAREALDRVGLADFAHRKSNQLSGGQAQRVAIARALVMEPEIILADEPTGNLDSATAKGIMQLFRNINDDGVTVVFITHEPDLAGWADSTVKVFDGNIVEGGNLN